MSLRTCSWLLPQKEQRYGTLGPLLLLVVVTRPSVLTRLVGRLLLRLLHRRHLGRDLRCRRSLSAHETRVVGLGDERVACRGVDGVDDAIVPRLLGRHEVVPVGVLDHLV